MHFGETMRLSHNQKKIKSPTPYTQISVTPCVHRSLKRVHLSKVYTHPTPYLKTRFEFAHRRIIVCVGANND